MVGSGAGPQAVITSAAIAKIIQAYFINWYSPNLIFLLYGDFIFIKGDRKIFTFAQTE
jgi:hypothetical protein